MDILDIEPKLAKTAVEEQKPVAQESVQPAVAEEAAPAPQEEKDPLLEAMLQVMRPSLEPENKIEAAPEPVEPKLEPAPEPVKEEQPEPQKKKAVINISKKEQAVEQPVIEPEPQPEPAPIAVDEDQQYSETLTDAQREELREAEIAERLFPERKGFKKKLLNWYRKFDDDVKELVKQDSSRSLSDDDDEFKAVLKTKPSLKNAEVKKVNRAIGVEEATAEADKKYKPELDEIKMQQKRIELQPKVEKWVNENFVVGLRSMVSSDKNSPIGDALKLAMEKGVEEATKEYPLEASIMSEEGASARARAQQFLLLKNEAVKFDSNNSDHKYLAGFIDRESKAFAEKGGKMKIKEGRQFLPRAEFSRIVSGNKSELAALDRDNWKSKSYWTFTDGEIVDFLAIDAKNTMERRVKSALETAEKLGFQRKQGGNTRKTQSEPQEVQPPKSQPSPSSGGADRSKTQANDEDEGVSVLATLYKR